MGSKVLFNHSLQKDAANSGTLSHTAELSYFFLQQDGSCTCCNNTALEFINKITKGDCTPVMDGFTGTINLKDYITPEDKPLFDEHLSRCSGSEEDVVTVLGIQMPHGSKQIIQLNSLPVFFTKEYGRQGYLTAVLKTNSSREVEDVFQRLEELNLVGKIAGSVAHEVRNPLTVVRGQLQLLSWDKSLKKHAEKIETMIIEIDRAVEILTELLYMSRPSQLRLEPSNINEVLEKLYQLLKAEALMNLHEVIYELNPVADVMLDKKRFRQVVYNLVNNGLQAMENHNSIIVSTYSRDNKVYFSVKDHGKGIPPEVLKRIGTPFLTTKASGTGLGLASCYNIVAKHGAAMEIDTGPGGTTFTIIFEAIES